MMAVLALALTLPACGRRSVDVATAESIELDLDRRNAERVARYYLGGFVGPDGGDPVEAGILSVDGSELSLHPRPLPEFARAALPGDADGILDADEFADWAQHTYVRARSLPQALDSLRAGRPWSERDTAWFTFSVDGSPMTRARRRLFVPTDALREAIGHFTEDGRLEYPPGTVIVGEHLVDGAVAETTVKRRRADGFWDFMVYDRAGRLADATSTQPRALRAPAQCTGCHLGSRLFEPDRSFPADAPAGPAGARGVVVPAAWRDAGAAAIFREHATRSDHVLGLYATVYVGRLRAERAAGRPLAAEDEEILRLLDD
jgi:hypothetical protein